MNKYNRESKYNRAKHDLRSVLMALMLIGACQSIAHAQTIDRAGKTLANSNAQAYGVTEATLSQPTVVTKPEHLAVERGFLDVTLPASLDTMFVDNARLILTASTVFDSTEPLIIAAFPATIDASSRPTAWSAEWDAMSGGFDPEYMAIASVDSTKEAVEIAMDVTQFVRLWQSGTIPNRGLVIKTLSEDKSTFHWIRDGRYGGQDARLEIRYSRIY